MGGGGGGGGQLGRNDCLSFFITKTFVTLAFEELKLLLDCLNDGRSSSQKDI